MNLASKLQERKMKLFEIPVYALSKNELEIRVKKREKEFHYYPYKHIDESMSDIAVSDTYPKKLYDYNHVVGMIVIYIDKYEVEAKLFKARYEKYYWKSGRKKFLEDMHINGAHSRYNINEIKDCIKTVYRIAASCVGKSMFIDDECFTNLVDLIDWTGVVEMMKMSGESALK